MKAFLLAAGFGARLRPLTLELPKPAWPFFDTPLAARALGLLAAARVSDVVVNLHHLPELLRETLTPWIPNSLRVRWSPEREILGTGGALVAWRAFFADGSFFLVNADTYQEIDLTEMARFHRSRGAIATLALRPSPSKSAPVEIDGDGRVVRFLSGQAPGHRPGIGCEFTGLHVLDPKILSRLGDGRFCINADVHRLLVAAGLPLFGYLPPEPSFWGDLGTPESYLGAHRWFLEQGRLPPGSPGRLVLRDETSEAGGLVRAPSYMGPGAQVERGGGAGPFATLCAAARVSAGARVSGSILWPGAVARGECLNVVLSGTGARLSAEARAFRSRNA